MTTIANLWCFISACFVKGTLGRHYRINSHIAAWKFHHLMLMVFGNMLKFPISSYICQYTGIKFDDMDYWLGKDGGILDPPWLHRRSKPQQLSPHGPSRRVRIVDFATSLESPIPGIRRSWYLPRMLNPQKQSNQTCVFLALVRWCR